MRPTDTGSSSLRSSVVEMGATTGFASGPAPGICVSVVITVTVMSEIIPTCIPFSTALIFGTLRLAMPGTINLMSRSFECRFSLRNGFDS